MARTGYVRRQRLHDALAPLGFRYGRPTSAVHDFNFIRPSSMPGLWESVDLGFAGKRQEVADVCVGVAVTSRISNVRFGTTEYLHEFDEFPLVDETGEFPEIEAIATGTEITDRAKAKAWEARVVEIAPNKARELALREGPGILLRTETLRKVCPMYLATLPLAGNLDDCAYQVRTNAPPELSHAAIRLAERGIFYPGDGEGAAYQLAAFALLQHSAEIEAGVSYFDVNPRENQDLRNRVDYLADLILQWEDEQEGDRDFYA